MLTSFGAALGRNTNNTANRLKSGNRPNRDEGHRKPGRLSLPANGRFNDAQILVQCFHSGTWVDATRRQLFKLLSEPLSVRTHFLERFAVLQTQIAIHNQSHCF
jgi:hypothetical protein